jgi:hypothetical protein
MLVDTANEIKDIITKSFDKWTSLPKRDEYQSACFSVPRLDENFQIMVEETFLREFADADITSNLFYDSTGHASYISAYVENYGISCYLLICHFYPVATLRVALDWMVAEGLSSQWDFMPDDKERLSLIHKYTDHRSLDLMNAGMLKIEDDISEILSQYNYLYLPWNSMEFNQVLESGFKVSKAWDYLFYLGVPAG